MLGPSWFALCHPFLPMWELVAGFPDSSTPGLVVSEEKASGRMCEPYTMEEGKLAPAVLSDFGSVCMVQAASEITDKKQLSQPLCALGSLSHVSVEVGRLGLNAWVKGRCRETPA